jgi:hypothetical protein
MEQINDRRESGKPTDITASNSLAEHAAEIRRLGKRVVADVIEIGARLTECKRICGHGQWLPWLDREFGWSADTAERFIQVNALSNQIPQLAEFNLPISGLYVLAAPSTPPEARDAIIERAQAGEPVSVSEIKQTIDVAKGRRHDADLADEDADGESGRCVSRGGGKFLDSAASHSCEATRRRDQDRRSRKRDRRTQDRER